MTVHVFEEIELLKDENELMNSMHDMVLTSS
nr:hypothetical protein [Alkalihalobacterium alkalinitrilicum]